METKWKKTQKNKNRCMFKLCLVVKEKTKEKDRLENAVGKVKRCWKR